LLRRLALSAIAGSVALVALTSSSAACACNPDAGTQRVTHGSSPAGYEWWQRAGYRREQDVLQVSFHFGEEGGATSVVDWSKRTSDDFAFVFGHGSDMDAAHEGEIDGFAFRVVRRLVVTMKDGTKLELRPVQAPRWQRKRHPYLRRLRFFVEILPAGSPSPKRAVAFDREGQRIGCQRDVDRGAFGRC
jgi:hypothetical protein